jgi:HSP20 family molecular chaperone IbpA
MSSTIKPTVQSGPVNAHNQKNLKTQNPLKNLEKKAQNTLKQNLLKTPPADRPHAKIATTYDRSGKVSRQDIIDINNSGATEDDYEYEYEDENDISSDADSIETEIVANKPVPPATLSSRKKTKENPEMTEIVDENEINKAAPKNTASISSKDSDTFYSVIDRQNVISEDSTGYIIEAYSPLGEKDNIRVSINNNKAIISGSRQSANKAEGDNRIVATNNYQTFREEFNLDAPVQSEGMQRQRVGDYVRIFIPKQQSK